MTYILLHHTGCSTSRNGLARLQANGIEPVIRKYMNAGEALTTEELKDIAKKMGNASPRAFLREKDAKKFDIPDSLSDEELYAAMADNPKLIQRPIGIKGEKAVLGRPVEKLLEI
ncbi:MAG: ArsC/Spx/MgsR family protein [Pseudomonadota bacterium]|nr:ArsC/Spx/MgsR family protein [Pseudomonadota bacterium]